MDKHFIVITRYQTKNKAHEEIQQYVAKWHNCLIDDAKLQELKDDIRREVDLVNTKHSRCQDITLELRSFTDHSQSISVEGNFIIGITKVRRFELTE